MANKNHIPTLEVNSFELKELHFRNKGWKVYRSHEIFHVNRLETARPQLHFPLPPHRKTVYDFLFLTKGTSVRSKGLSKYEMRANDFFFLPAGQITAHESMSEDTEGFFLHFSPNIFGEQLHLLRPFTFLHFHTHPVISIDDATRTAALAIIQRLLDIYESEKSLDYDLLRWYLLALFAELKPHAASIELPATSSATALTQRYKDVLTQHIYTYHTVREFAHLLHVTPNHLNKCIKKTLNKTAQSLLNEMLILEAKSLLRYSDLTIAQIAEQLCGNSPSNFSRFFKSQTGQSPREYKKL